jgi:hypothetical protein
VNRALPPGDCGDRGADPGRASGRTRPVPGTVGLVGRSENPPKRATLPSQYPAARDLGLDAVGALSAFRLGGLDRQAHFLADGAADETANAVRQPTGGFHQFLRRSPPSRLRRSRTFSVLKSGASSAGRKRHDGTDERRNGSRA